jgi:hypothetical protein
LDAIRSSQGLRLREKGKVVAVKTSGACAGDGTSGHVKQSLAANLSGRYVMALHGHFGTAYGRHQPMPESEVFHPNPTRPDLQTPKPSPPASQPTMRYHIRNPPTILAYLAFITLKTQVSQPPALLVSVTDNAMPDRMEKQ